MEPRSMKRVVALGAALVVVMGAAAWWTVGRGGAGGVEQPPAQGAPVPRVVPIGTRIRVEVLNTTTVRGQARLVSLYLRDAGFDVVKYAGEGPSRDSTLVLDRTGHPEWAQLASRALGGAAVESRPDSSRYVDLTILVGKVVHTPPEAFYP
ncbi:MAG: LytR C-terminal domain-containing protein [Gemmatimonadota bacterium]